MKTKISLIIISVLSVIFISSCNKTNSKPDDLVNEISGTYVGTLTTTSNLKSYTGGTPSTAEVTALDSNQIQVHCYAEGFDTTIMLDIYENHDSVMVCMTGEDFEGEYGHMNGHMNHEMHMGGGTDWQHHLDDEHGENDEHYGMFTRINHSFEYAFKMMASDSSYYKIFEGTKVSDR